MKKFKVLSIVVVGISVLFVMGFVTNPVFANPTISLNNAQYPGSAYFTDHGMYITVTGITGNPSTIPVKVWSTTSGSTGSNVLNLNFIPNGIGGYVVPNGWVYFTTAGSSDPLKPAIMISPNNFSDVITINATYPAGVSSIVTTHVQSPAYGTFPPYNATRQPNLTWVGNGDGTNPCTPSSSSDGICDSWKVTNTNLAITSSTGTTGLDIPYNDGTNTIHYTLQCTSNSTTLQNHLGLDYPCPIIGNRDVYVEVDYLEAHKPYQNGITNIVNSFKNAPSHNPPLQCNAGSLCTAGITLHVFVDDQIPYHSDQLAGPTNGNAGNTDFDKLKKAYFGTYAERNAISPYDCNGKTITPDKCVSDTLTGKRQVFHYVIFTHSQYSSSSGISELPGNDIDVSLGAWAGGVGTPDDQAGTLMHELGHNLNLHHGGNDDINCKPNYLSVMNWALQFSAWYGGSTRPLDYSHEVDPIDQAGVLNEAAIDENKGIATNTPGQEFIYGGPRGLNNIGTTGTTNHDVPVDMNKDGQYTSIRQAIHYNTPPGCTDNTISTLNGYNDWGGLILDMFQTGSTSMQDGAPRNTVAPYGGG